MPRQQTRSVYTPIRSSSEGFFSRVVRMKHDLHYGLLSVLSGLSTGSLTRAVIMDHLDWFAPGAKDVDDEVFELARVLSPGGFVLWRSAGRQPWYQEV